MNTIRSIHITIRSRLKFIHGIRVRHAGTAVAHEIEVFVVVTVDGLDFVAQIGIQSPAHMHTIKAAR